MTEEWKPLNGIVAFAKAVAADMEIEVTSKSEPMQLLDTDLDAARYRWLRDGNNDTEGLFPALSGTDLDVAIDEAIRNHRNQSPADRAELGLPNHLDPLSKPAMKKVKSLCWRSESNGNTLWQDEQFICPGIGWKRFPAGDIEGEVEA